MARPGRRRGQFRIIDMFAAIAVVALALMLIPPTLRSPHRSTRLMECLSNMRNVAMALQTYEMINRHWPAYADTLKMNNGRMYSDPATGELRSVSYVIPLLPYLDQPALDKLWRDPAAGKYKPGATQPTQQVDSRLEILICPSDAPDKRNVAFPLSYVLNCGMADLAADSAAVKAGMPRDWAANGVFFDNTFPAGQQLSDDLGMFSKGRAPLSGMSAEYISRGDGLGQTCLLSENVDAGEYSDAAEAAVGILWDGSGKPDMTQDPPHLQPSKDVRMINVQSGGSGGKPTPQYARPSSFHPRGVNMAFCDGKVRFVSDSMDYYVYCLLMSPYSAKVKMPGSLKVLPGFDRPLDEAWFMK